MVKTKIPKRSSIRQKRKKEVSNDFPLDAFPPKIQHFISEFHRGTLLPISYYGLSMLTITGALVGNAYKLQVENRRTICALLYSMLIGKSSAGKSPVMGQCFEPLQKIEMELQKSYQKRLKEWKDNGEEGDKPVRGDLVVIDATQEALVKTMSENPRGFLYYRDEGIAWIDSQNQYRNGSDGAFWLENFNNRIYKKNRVSSEFLFMPHSFIPVLGGMQPSRLEKLAEDGRKDNGYLFRILFAFPPKGYQKPPRSNYSIAPQTFDEYENLIGNLHYLPNKIGIQDDGSMKYEYIPLSLSDDARGAYNQWYDKNRQLMIATDNASVESLFGKLEILVYRIALILKMMDCVCRGEEVTFKTKIEKEIMQNAIKLIEYFRGTGLRVLNIIEKDDPLSELTTDKQKLFAALPDIFSTAQAKEVGAKNNKNAKFVTRFLKDRELFEKLGHGQYQKLA